MRFLYSLSIHLYQLAIRLASAFNPKAKKWISGRRDIFSRLEAVFSGPGNERVVWFHCASLGEFEQGRPVIERYRALYPQAKILLTFFSPSGYEIRKDYKGADLIFYLPADTLSNARRFISVVKPSAAFFIKYEFWFNYLMVLKERNVPVYLISGIFRKEQHFFRSYGAWFRTQLSAFSHFFLQDESSAELLKDIGYTNTSVSGDTRFDRVAEIALQKRSFPLLGSFCSGKKVLVAGSTWEQDERILAGAGLTSKGLKLILAPHEIHEAHLAGTLRIFSGCRVVRYSQAAGSDLASADILLIDNIGMLSSLYQYGSIAFIGGGFGKGIHNILEAATFGLPVIFGPNYAKFREATDLIRAGGAFAVDDEAGLTATLSLLEDPQVLATASHISSHYVRSRAGAAERILSAIPS